MSGRTSLYYPLATTSVKKSISSITNYYINQCRSHIPRHNLHRTLRAYLLLIAAIYRTPLATLRSRPSSSMRFPILISTITADEGVEEATKQPSWCFPPTPISVRTEVKLFFRRSMSKKHRRVNRLCSSFVSYSGLRGRSQGANRRASSSAFPSSTYPGCMRASHPRFRLLQPKVCTRGYLLHK